MIPISHIPHEPGIYIFKNSSWEVLYIGKAKNLHKRVQQYFTPWSLWKQEMLAKSKSVEYVSVHNESEALYLESNLIKEHQPPFNSLLKWDNSYCFIKIPKEDFPPIMITRKRVDDGAIYIWPKHQRNVVKEFLQYLRQVLKFRTMKTSIFRQGKLDSDFYFGLDKWWSVFAKLKTKSKQTEETLSYAEKQWLVIDKSYEEYKQEYASIVKQIVAFFRGDTKPITETIHNHIQEAIQQEHFERAAKLRDIYMKIDSLAERQTVEMEQHISWYVWYVQTLGWWTVFVIFKIFEGKIIDIIRHKQRDDDMDLAAFAATVENEYGDMQRYEANNSAIQWKIDTIKNEFWSLVFVDKQIKKIKKSTLNGFFELLKKSFDDFVTVSSFEKESLMNDILKTLQERYKLAHFPYRIECIDISHLSGWWMSGWLSCLVWWLKNPKWYRRYKIKSIKTIDQQNNDYLALEEVLIRRLWTKTINDGWYIPDLFVIDGGKWQLGVVQKLIQDKKIHPDVVEKTQFVSLGKWSARKRSSKNTGEKEVIYTLSHNTLTKKTLIYDEVDMVLTKIRDESHRFANAYRKKQMSKERK